MTSKKLRYMKEQIKENISVREAVKVYTGVEAGKKNIHCVFHEDKKPSMNVDEKVYNCFSCLRGGDVIGFVMEYFGLGFIQAMMKIDSDFGLLLYDEEISIDQQKAIAERETEAKRRKAEKQEQEERQRKFADKYGECHRKLVSGELEPFSKEWCECQNKIAYLEQYL